MVVEAHIVASTVTIATHRAAANWPWYIIRAAGFIAAGLLVLLMLSGIGQVTGILYRFVQPITAWAIHRALALALCACILVHIGFLLIDKFLPFSWTQILVPFASHYNNGTEMFGLSLGVAAVAFGILAMYGVAIVVASSLGWIDTKTRVWRKLHYINYAIAGLVFLHALYTGSDLKYGGFRAIWILIGLVVEVGIVMRIWRAGTTKRTAQKEEPLL